MAVNPDHQFLEKTSIDIGRYINKRDLREKSKNIVLTYLDTTKTYKLKTGMFKIEDSLSLNEDDFKEDDRSEYKVDDLNNETRKPVRPPKFFFEELAKINKKQMEEL